MTKASNITIIPAQAGYNEVVAFDEQKELAVGEPIIAWRVETYAVKDSDNFFSVSFAITADGDVVSNCVGTLNPDKSITLFNDGTYENLDTATKTHFST